MNNPVYAKGIHDTVRKAREAMTEQAQTDALDTINQHFALSVDELNFLRLPTDYYSRACRVCTNTRPDLYLLDFATKTANYAALVPPAS